MLGKTKTQWHILQPVLWVALYMGCCLSNLYLGRGTFWMQMAGKSGLATLLDARWVAFLLGGVFPCVVYALVLRANKNSLLVARLPESQGVVWLALVLASVASLAIGIAKLLYFAAPFVYLWGESLIESVVLVLVLVVFKRGVFALIKQEVRAYWVTKLYAKNALGIFVLFKVVAFVQSLL